jgi:hypothetical protein
MLPQAATDFYALQQRVNATNAAEVGRLWRKMGDDLDASFARLITPMLAVLTEAQAQVTKAAGEYVPRLLDEARIPDRPAADFRPDSLVGMASDGRPLGSLAYGAVTTTKEAIGNGSSTEAALEQGGNWLDLMAKLQVADAARQAVGILTTSRKNLAGNVRVLNPPSCQRCAILAGRFYKWSTGFQRHPRCDCTMAPVPSKAYAEAEGFIQSPMDAYRNGEIRDLTEAQRFAIDNGADISRVVNATRGMSTTATERSLSARASRLANRNTGTAPVVLPGHPDLLGGLTFNKPTEAPIFLTPEGIYQQAAGDRDGAIRLLRHWGYLA